MTGKDLYNAFSDIDEHFLWEREEIIREQNTAKKTSYPIRITIAVAACLSFLFMIYSAEKNTINKIIPESRTNASVPLSDPSESNQNDIGSHAGEGNSIIVDIDNYEQIPKELIINSNLTGKVKYLTGIPKEEHYYDSTYSSAMSTKRISALKELLSITGAEDFEIEYGTDGIFPKVFLNRTEIISFDSYFAIECDEILSKLTNDSTDDEIISYFTENLYIDALMQFIGLDNSNLFISRESIFFYNESENNDSPESIMTTFRITNNSVLPQQLSFNLNSKYINFSITESYTDNSITISSVYGYYTDKNYEFNTDNYTSYDEAVKIAENTYDNFSEKEIKVCTIIYKNQSEAGFDSIKPFYKFIYHSDNKICIITIPLLK